MTPKRRNGMNINFLHQDQELYNYNIFSLYLSLMCDTQNDPEKNNVQYI